MSVRSRILAETAPTSRRVTAYAVAFEPRTPPEEIQLWNAGDNPTDYGVHKWTARSIAEAFGRYEARGNPLLIDVEHNGAKAEDDGEPTVTGGYARLEIRDGAPWLRFDWSSYATEQIATGQRRFLSPEYDVDKNTGEIVALYRVSLVADPGTHRARMLAAATHQEKSMDIAMILAALRAALAAEDPAVVKESLGNLVTELAKSAGVDAPAGTEQTADADATDKGDEPVAAGTDTPAGDAPAADTEKKAAAATTPAPAKVAAAAPATTAPVVDKVAAAAVLQIENAQRDHLMLTAGDRLEPSIRRWASSQPLAVVRGLIDATPAAQSPTVRASATRGETQGQAEKPKGLEGRDLEEMQRSMGTFKASAVDAHVTEAGVLVLPSVPPSVLRERKRAAAAAAVAAGKAGK